MKISEKIEVVGTILAMLTIFSLFQSPSLNALGILMAIRLLFRYGNLRKRSNSSADDSGAIDDKYNGIIATVVDSTCSLAVTIELLSLPAMVLYLISPYQSLNFVIGASLGVALTIVAHRRILKLARIWFWFITFNLSMAFVIILKVLSL